MKNARGRTGKRRRRRIAFLVAVILPALVVLQQSRTPTPRRSCATVDLTGLAAPGCASGFNLVLITLDTVRADRLGCYGYSRARTPAIDGLADRGVVFGQAIAPTSVTLPSHATILTGLTAPSHGVRNNGSFRLAGARRTVAETLGENGYRTAAFIGAYVLDARYGLDQGFDHYDDEVNVTGKPAEGAHYVERSAGHVTEAALAWLEGPPAREKQQPFFMWVHYYDAHYPYAPPESFTDSLPRDPYDREIAYTDTQIRRVVDALRAKNLIDRTLIVVTADHGEGLGEHDEATHSLLVYDTTVHVPLVFSCPALFRVPTRVDDRVVGLVDIVPTVLGMLGVSSDGAVDGRNVFTSAPDEARAIYIETMASLMNNGWSPLSGLRRLNDKFILAPRPEFYDLLADAGETDNLFDTEAPAIIALADQLDEKLEGWPSVESMVAQARTMDPEEAARLAALGYVNTLGGGAALGVADPKDMMQIYYRIMNAEAQSTAGDHLRAVEMIESVLAEDSTNARAWDAARMIYKRLGRFDDAERCVRRFCELNPTSDGFVNLAQFLLARGAVAEFEGALLEAERLDPANGDVFIARGDRHAMGGRYREALEEFERALAVDPAKVGPVAREKIALVKARLP